MSSNTWQRERVLQLLSALFVVALGVGLARAFSHTQRLQQAAVTGARSGSETGGSEKTAATTNAPACSQPDLQFHILHGNLAMVRQLLKMGCNVSAVDHHGATPLHLAAAFGHKEIAQGESIKTHAACAPHFVHCI